MRWLGNLFRLLIEVLLLVILIGCQSEVPSFQKATETAVSPSTPTVFIRRVTINPDERRQVIQQVGSGAFIHRFGGVDRATDPISELNLQTFQPQYVRVAMDLFSWEPVNDNDDPLVMEDSAFKDAGFNHPTFQFIQLMSSRKAEITASIWEVPDWMVEDPSAESARIIPRSLYPEAVESIAAWLLYARDQYGVEVAYVSFNEANLGINVLLSPEDVIALLKIAGPRFAELGLKTKWLLGDCSNIGECLNYVRPIWSEESIRSYLGPLAFHSWDVLSLSDNAIAALGEFAFQNELEVRCTEGGWDPSLWQRPDEFSGWNHARRIAAAYSRVLKLSRAEVVYYWQMMGRDYSLNDGSKPYPAMEILRQINERIPPGSQIIATSPNSTSFSSTAAITPSGIVVLLVNESLPEKVSLSGLPDGSYALVGNTRDGLNQSLGVLKTVDGTVSFDMSGFGVFWLVQIKP